MKSQRPTSDVIRSNPSFVYSPTNISTHIYLPTDSVHFPTPKYLQLDHKVLFAFIKLGQRFKLLSEDPDAEVPNRVLKLVTRMLPRRDREYLIQLFESERWSDEKKKKMSADVEAGLPTKERNTDL